MTSLLPGGSPSALAQTASDTLAGATDLVRQGQYDAALAELEKALHTHPDDPRLRTVQGVAYSLKGDDADALASLRAALKIAPNFPAALQTEAEILVRHHDPAATPVLAKILAADPGNSTAREMLALAEAQNNNCAAALGDFAQVLPALGNHPESLQLYGACLFETGKYAEATTVFERLHTLRPDDPSTLYDLALAQAQSGNNKAAATTLAPLLEHAPDPETLMLGSDIAEDLGDTPRAAALMRAAIVADPARASSYVRFAELCMTHESYQAGVDMVTAGISRIPKEPSLFLARGLLFGGMAQYDKAEADFHSAELYDPHHGTGAYAVGLVQSQRNNPEAALATVRTALKGHPEDAQLHYLLARILVEGGATPRSPAFAEALASSQAAVHLDPKLVNAHDLLAKMYMETGEHALAIEQCRAALALDASDQNALYRLMRSLRETGDSAGAQALAKQVADLHQQSRQGEANHLRYRIEGAAAPPSGSPLGSSPRQP